MVFFCLLSLFILSFKKYNFYSMVVSIPECRKFLDLKELINQNKTVGVLSQIFIR